GRRKTHRRVGGFEREIALERALELLPALQVAPRAKQPVQAFRIAREFVAELPQQVPGALPLAFAEKRHAQTEARLARITTVAERGGKCAGGRTIIATLDREHTAHQPGLGVLWLARQERVEVRGSDFEPPLLDGAAGEIQLVFRGATRCERGAAGRGRSAAL